MSMRGPSRVGKVGSTPCGTVRTAVSAAGGRWARALGTKGPNTDEDLDVLIFATRRCYRRGREVAADAAPIVMGPTQDWGPFTVGTRASRIWRAAESGAELSLGRS